LIYDQNALTANDTISRYSLVPIDHGLVMPDCLDVSIFDITWYDMEQTKKPILIDLLNIIELMDPEADWADLTQYFSLRADCLRVLLVTTCLLKTATSLDCNIHQIATMWLRRDIEQPSILETIVTNCIMTSVETFKQPNADLGLQTPMGKALYSGELLKCVENDDSCFSYKEEEKTWTIDFKNIFVRRMFTDILRARLSEYILKHVIT